MYYALAFVRMLGILLAEHRRQAWRRREAYDRHIQAVPPVIRTFRRRPPEARGNVTRQGW